MRTNLRQEQDWRLLLDLKDFAEALRQDHSRDIVHGRLRTAVWDAIVTLRERELADGLDDPWPPTPQREEPMLCGRPTKSNAGKPCKNYAVIGGASACGNHLTAEERQAAAKWRAVYENQWWEWGCAVGAPYPEEMAVHLLPGLVEQIVVKGPDPF